MSSEALIEARALTKYFQRGQETIRVLDHLDLVVPKGSFLALMGPSGSGKSTLLNLCGGLDVPTEGELKVNGEDITRFNNDELASWRARNVGFIFQTFNLIPVLSALENVELPLLLTRLPRRERRERAAFALERVGLAERTSHRPGQLSGGQEQRVAIARALVMDPLFLLADEPTGDLDRASTEGVLDLLQHLHEQQHKSIVMVTHDPLAAQRAESILHLDNGRVLEVVEHPA
jgi:putative ABC transport system ATP-binding protein